MLDRAILREADLREARLARASLRFAILEDTILEGAILAQTDLEGCRMATPSVVILGSGVGKTALLSRLKQELYLRVYTTSRLGKLEEREEKQLKEWLREIEPRVVHFASYYEKQVEIAQSLVRLLRRSVQCVVLSNSWPVAQAESLAKEVKCVIRLNRTLGEGNTVPFLVQVYRALSRGDPIEKVLEHRRLSLGEVQIFGRESSPRGDSLYNGEMGDEMRR